MNVLITGSRGYIGSVLAKRMHEQGIRLLGCDYAPIPYPTKKREPLFVREFGITFEDDFIVRNVINYNIDVIVHLAATSTVGPDATNPIDYYENNTARTTTFIKKLKDAGWHGHFIFASTAAVYDPDSGQAANEYQTKLLPNNVYGLSKLHCEQMLSWCSNYGIDVTSFRFFNVAGAYQGYGEEHEDTHLISRICRSVIDDKELVVYGDNYDTRDGTCIRDYVHVNDICDAIIFAAQEERYGTYNLGTKRGVSVKEMIEQFEMHTGQKVKWSVGERRAGDLPFLVADPSKFQRMTGFQYTYSLRDIINSSWEHFKNGI